MPNLTNDHRSGIIIVSLVVNDILFSFLLKTLVDFSIISLLYIYIQPIKNPETSINAM